MAGEIASFASKAVERISPPGFREPLAVGGVVIFGRDQLDPAPPDSVAPFIERWQAAMSFHLGAEEFEKFCMTRRKTSLPP
ncbi:MAG TPA: hypothetical protein VN685_02020 [Rhizomicrobium sp.]|nr:hypothetical protein [Rhizomicrobium sp.]